MTNVKIAALAFGLTFCMFLSSARYDFVEYDDVEYVLENDHMREGITASNIVWALRSVGYASNWHPLAWASMMADVSVFRTFCKDTADSAWGYRNEGNGKPKWSAGMTRLSNVMHLHNVLLHSLNAALLCILLILVGKGRVSNLWVLGLTLLWALHPLRVEVVCWVAERKEVLSVFWMLLATICWVRRDESRNSTIAEALSLICFALALLAKPVAVTLPAVLLAWDWIFGRKVRVLRILPFVVLSALTCVLTMSAQEAAQETGGWTGAVSRVTSVFVAPLIYIRQMIWPAGLSIFYEKSTNLNVPAVVGGVLLCALCLALGVVWLVRELRKKPRNSVLDIAAFGIAWVYVGLLPMLGIVKVGQQEHNDRYTYWIGCGVCVVLVLLFTEFLPSLRRIVARCSTGDAEKDWRDLRKFSLYGLGAILVVLAFLTNGRMQCWRNTTALFYDAVPKCWEGPIAKSLVLKLRYVSPEAEQQGEWYLRECLTRHPNCENANCLAEYLLLGKSGDEEELAKLGIENFSEAEGLIKDVLRSDPENEKALELKTELEKRRGAAKNVQRQ